jgi:hypothetical protein
MDETMIRMIVTLALLTVELVLLIVAVKSWVSTSRSEFSIWRNALSLVAFCLLFLNWFGAVSLAVVVLGNYGQGASGPLSLAVFILSRPLVLVGMLFAIALGKRSRLETTFAGIFMLVGLPLGYV